MRTKLKLSDSSDIKDTMLYNFATFRDPEYINKKDINEIIHFINLL